LKRKDWGFWGEQGGGGIFKKCKGWAGRTEPGPLVAWGNAGREIGRLAKDSNEIGKAEEGEWSWNE